jgi:hypothetical protein
MLEINYLTESKYIQPEISIIILGKKKKKKKGHHKKTPHFYAGKPP